MVFLAKFSHGTLLCDNEWDDLCTYAGNHWSRKAFRDLTRMEPLEGHRMIRSRAARRSNGWKRGFNDLY